MATADASDNGHAEAMVKAGRGESRGRMMRK
jgi:hypothetical protein